MGIDHFPNIQNLHLRTPGQGLYSLFDLTPICFVVNNFRTQNHGAWDGALMRNISR